MHGGLRLSRLGPFRSLDCEHSGDDSLEFIRLPDEFENLKMA
jgi:hypothetical protein